MREYKSNEEHVEGIRNGLDQGYKINDYLRIFLFYLVQAKKSLVCKEISYFFSYY